LIDAGLRVSFLGFGSISETTFLEACLLFCTLLRASLALCNTGLLGVSSPGSFAALLLAPAHAWRLLQLEETWL
jgi:hypothetical protein